MKSRTIKRLASTFLILAITLTVATVPQLTRVTRASAQGTGTANLVITCGVVSAYTAPVPGTSPGSITIAGQTISIGAGVTVTGSPAVSAAGCFQYNTDVSGNLVSASFVPVPAGIQAVCGTVTAYTAPANGTTAGSVTINGTQIFIPAGTVVTGAGTGVVGSNVCFEYTLDVSGNLVSAGFVPNATAPVTICGPVTAFTAPTGSTAGSLVIGGVTVPLVVGSAAAFAATTPTVGQTQSITLNLNGAGQVTSATIAAGTCTGTTLTGAFTSFTAATATTGGLATIAGLNFTIAAGTNVTVNGGVPLAAIAVTHSGVPSRLHLAHGG